MLVAAAALTESRAAELLAHREKTPFAEIDLLLRESGFLRMIEVKSLGRHGFLETRVGLRQRERLLAARLWTEGRWARPVSLDLAVVDPHGRITWIPDFLS